MAPTHDAHLWRSPLLGEPKHADIAHGRIQYFERGHGPTLVFVHGWLANANLWRSVIDDLASDFRCIAVDMPLGAHRIPVLPGADLTPNGCASIIRDFLEVMNLDQLTLVGNDSGGAYSQITTANDSSRISRLVLNACETPFDPFPPPPFDGLPAIAQSPARFGELLAGLRNPDIRNSEGAFGLLSKRPLDGEASDSYALPSIVEPGVLADFCRVVAATTPSAHHPAGRKLIADFPAPTLLAWNSEDRVFPPSHAERYAAELTNGTFVAIDDSYAFTPEDQPAQLAQVIRDFRADG